MDMISPLPERDQNTRERELPSFEKGSINICDNRYFSKSMFIARVESRDNKRHIVSLHVGAFTRNNYPTSLESFTR